MVKNKHELLAEVQKYLDDRGYDYRMPFALKRAVEDTLDMATTCVSEDDIKWVEVTLDVIAEGIAHFKEDILKQARQSAQCPHAEYLPATYTHQRRVVGYMFVYQHKCAACGNVETVQVRDEQDKPDWAADARQQYYNNSI